jgi:hypothetical protein
VAVVLRRLLAPASRLSAGEWSSETASGREAWACPSCGAIAELSPTHRVLRGGLVSPILGCGETACPWSDFAQLEAHGEPYV